MADKEKTFEFKRGQQVVVRGRKRKRFCVIQVDPANELMVLMDWDKAIATDALDKVKP